MMQVTNEPPETKLYVNGINAETGELLVPPLAYNQVVALTAKRTPEEKGLAIWLKRVWTTISHPHLGLPVGVDPADVIQAGWAIVFHKDENVAVKAALQALVEHRKRQIGNELKVKVLEYRDGETTAQWMARYGVGAGSVEPTRIPYYVLLVGSPGRIPFTFGFQLDVEYGVGRLHFETPEEYGQYVQSLIKYETAQTVLNGREVVFFGTRHRGDQATELSADHLIRSLAVGVVNSSTNVSGVAASKGFRSSLHLADSATKATLENILNQKSEQAPALLFTATHGIGLPSGHPNQRYVQGALLCQDWRGGPVGPDTYFAAADLRPDARVHGLITFHFACYGMGTPERDRFMHKQGEAPLAIAPESFISALPKALLAHPGGGALACIGHVERAWGYSIISPGTGAQLLPFQNAISRILDGQPLGYAMKDFNERYAALSTNLASLLEEIGFGATVSERELALTWVERNDAEGYAIIGDPAVRMRVHDLV
jgi:hypothetical protein